MNLYFEKTSFSHVTKEADTSDEWDRDDTSTEWSFGRLGLTKRQYEESFPVSFDVKAGDIVFAVVAVWSTGNSFSHDEQHCSELFGIFKDANEALEFEKALKNKSVPDIYYPWDGYFESLDYIELLTRIVEP